MMASLAGKSLSFPRFLADFSSSVDIQRAIFEGIGSKSFYRRTAGKGGE
jgi:hypothetical protein